MIPRCLSSPDASLKYGFGGSDDPLLYPEEEEERESQVALSRIVETWEPDVAEAIRSKLWQHRDQDHMSSRPLMAALVGMPGSGKSTSAEVLAGILSHRHGIRTVVMPHDGYHYHLEHLLQQPDAADLIYRRGAPETFDAACLLRDLRRIRNGNDQEDEEVAVPGFDHSRGDPDPNAHVFLRGYHDVVLVEGLYLLHDSDGWQDVALEFDLSVYLDVDVDQCMGRVMRRNRCLPGYTPEEIDVRVDAVDRVNATIVARSKARADLVVPGPSFNAALLVADDEKKRKNFQRRVFFESATICPEVPATPERPIMLNMHRSLSTTAIDLYGAAALPLCSFVA